jgi:hypothetical protein
VIKVINVIRMSDLSSDSSCEIEEEEEEGTAIRPYMYEPVGAVCVSSTTALPHPPSVVDRCAGRINQDVKLW